VQALREWQASKDCKRTIDDFLEQLPLFRMLASKAMRPRHWQDIMKLTGVAHPLTRNPSLSSPIFQCNVQ
jgi:dynein heavy chain